MRFSATNGKPGQTPDGVDATLRWPAPASALYPVINEVLGEEQYSAPAPQPTAGALDAAIEAKAFAELEKSLGFKTLVDILQSYLTIAEELANALTQSLEARNRDQAGKVAQDIAGAAGGLGLAALTFSARALAQGAREHSETESLVEAAEGELAQHARVRQALCRLYPDLAA